VARILSRIRPQAPYPGYRIARSGNGVVPLPVDLPDAQIAPSQPGFGPTLGTWVKLPGANFQPAGSIPVDLVGDANIAPGASGTVLITYQVPDTLRFRIAGIGFGADDEAALTFLTWTIQANGLSVPGYTGIPAAIGSIPQLADIFVLRSSFELVTVVANVAPTAVVTYRYICRLRGWSFAEKES
jgi:hypothetical protein